MLFNYLLTWRPSKPSSQDAYSYAFHRHSQMSHQRNQKDQRSIAGFLSHAQASQTNAIREALKAIASQALEVDGVGNQNGGKESETSHLIAHATGDYLRLGECLPPFNHGRAAQAALLEAVQLTNNVDEQNGPSCPNLWISVIPVYCLITDLSYLFIFMSILL